MDICERCPKGEEWASSSDALKGVKNGERRTLADVFYLECSGEKRNRNIWSNNSEYFFNKKGEKIN